MINTSGQHKMQVFDLTPFRQVLICNLCIFIGMALLSSGLQAEILNTPKSLNISPSSETRVRKCSPGLVHQTLNMTNQLRASKGVKQLSFHPQLTQSATARSLEMAYSQDLSHEGWLDSFKRIGFEYNNYYTSEIIAYGYKTAEAVIEGWNNSRSHRRSLVNSRYNYVGIGCAIDPKGVVWWTEHFSGKIYD